MWFRRRQFVSPIADQAWSLDMPLGTFSRSDVWRLRDAVTGTIIFGSTGSGKTSGAGRFCLKRLLASGLGGLVLTVKAQDREDIERYARECGRSADVVIFEPDGVHRCNLLDHELHGNGGNAALRLENGVQFFKTAMEIAERDRGNSSGSGENKYFKRANDELLRAVMLTLIVAKEDITLENIHHLVMSAPRSLDESKDTAWRERSYCYRTLCKADDQSLANNLARDFEYSLVYLMNVWPSMDQRTRSNILSTYTTTVDTFQRGVIRQSFFGETTITPDACREGKIFVIDLPVLQWNETGRIMQAVFKFVWQRSQERCGEELKQRPVFLYSDEASQFFTSFDAPFQATARSSRVCTVYLTQNLPGMYESVGGESGRHSIDALLGNLRLKIFHAQDDPVTCQWQSELIGKTKRYLFNSGSQGANEANFDFFNPRRNHSAGMSENWEYEIQPWEWSREFRTGGPQHRNIVDAVLFQGGRSWQANGKAYLPVSFDQREEY